MDGIILYVVYAWMGLIFLSIVVGIITEEVQLAQVRKQIMRMHQRDVDWTHTRSARISQDPYFADMKCTTCYYKGRPVVRHTHDYTCPNCRTDSMV